MTEALAGRSVVPTFSRCVIGYRAWVADSRHRLWPISDHRRHWAPGVNRARCNCRTPDALRFEWSIIEGRRVLESVPQHEAPGADCECGLYSWRRPPRSWWQDCSESSLPVVVGAVASWGSLRVHDAGFRAEYSCVVVLAHHNETKTHALATLLAIASDYRVELATLDELEQVANNHGSPLPDDLRPATAAASEQGQASGAVAGEADRSSTTPDATPDEVCSAVRVGFDGRPLKSNGADLTGGTSRGF